MALPGDPFFIPHFLKAATPERLRLLCLENNIKNGKEYKYFSPFFDGKIWIIWYFEKAQEYTNFMRAKK